MSSTSCFPGPISERCSWEKVTDFPPGSGGSAIPCPRKAGWFWTPVPVGPWKNKANHWLAIGVVRVEGDFSKGEVVSLVDQAGTEFARGLTNYDTSAARAIAGEKNRRDHARVFCPLCGSNPSGQSGRDESGQVVSPKVDFARTGRASYNVPRTLFLSWRFEFMSEPAAATSGTGFVYLVGAGPGDPGLLTLRGAECLSRADLVLYDGLVNPLLLRHSQASAERTCRVDGPSGRTIPQAEINHRLIEAARTGQIVVRLKGGDPFYLRTWFRGSGSPVRSGNSFRSCPGHHGRHSCRSLYRNLFNAPESTPLLLPLSRVTKILRSRRRWITLRLRVFQERSCSTWDCIDSPRLPSR